MSNTDTQKTHDTSSAADGRVGSSDLLGVVRCAECRHWKTQPPHGEWLADFVLRGMCGRIYEGSLEDGAKAETFNHCGDDSGLMTEPDFGCTHGESA